MAGSHGCGLGRVLGWIALALLTPCVALVSSEATDGASPARVLRVRIPHPTGRICCISMTFFWNPPCLLIIFSKLYEKVWEPRRFCQLWNHLGLEMFYSSHYAFIKFWLIYSMDKDLTIGRKRIRKAYGSTRWIILTSFSDRKRKACSYCSCWPVYLDLHEDLWSLQCTTVSAFFEMFPGGP